MCNLNRRLSIVLFEISDPQNIMQLQVLNYTNSLCQESSVEFRLCQRESELE